MAVVFVYRGVSQQSSGSDRLISINALRKALGLLLNFYPHLAGQLQINAKTGSRQVVFPSKGALLLQARCDTRLDDLQKFSTLTLAELPSSGNDLLPSLDLSVEAACDHPVFAIQHTRFACGGVSLGVKVLHTLCDAEGFFLLTRHLAEIYRQVASGLADDAISLERPPHITSYLSASDRQADEGSTDISDFVPKYMYEHNDEAPRKPPRSDPPSPSAVVGKVVQFSAEDLKRLKAKAMGDGKNGWVSTFEALSAYLFQVQFQARSKLRETQGEQKKLLSDFLTPVNLRGPDRLALGPVYFPNALTCFSSTFAQDVLLHEPLPAVARLMHELLRSCDADHERKSAQWVAALPDRTKIRNIYHHGPGSLMLSQWSAFDLHTDTHFDTDARGLPISPVLVAPPFTPVSLIDGLGYLVSPRESGIDCYLALEESVWDVLDNEPEFSMYPSSRLN